MSLSPTESPSQAVKYNPVYLAKFRLTMQDPDMPQPRYHHIIFVRTNPRDGSGIKFHVTGDITSHGGMTYESVPFPKPSEDENFHAEDLLGYTLADGGFEARWDRLLADLPRPPKQKEFNIATMRTELFKSLQPLTFYQPGEERTPPWKCTEWTNNHAIPALFQAGLIVETLPADAEAASIN